MPGIPNRWSTVFPAFKREFERKRGQYSKVLVQAALVRTREGKGVYRANLRFTREEDLLANQGLPPPLDLGAVVLTTSYIEVEEAFRVIERGRRHEESIPQLGATSGPFSGDLVDQFFLADMPVPLEARQPLDWPKREFNFTRHPRYPIELPGNRVHGYPQFEGTDLGAIVDWWTQTTPAYKTAECKAFVRAVLPDFRARISSVIHDGHTFLVSTDHLLDRDNETSLHCGLGPQSIIQRPIGGEDGSGTPRPYEYHPPVVHILLAEKVSNDTLDWVRVQNTEGEANPSVRRASQSETLSLLIRGGETEKVEFKHHAGRIEDVIETAVAFANTDGGTILIGVDDDGHVVGVDATEEEGKLANRVHALCDPPIRFESRTVKVGEQRVLLIDVPRGRDPPYFHRQKGVAYIRHGTSDRPATRSELEKLFQKRFAERGQS